LWGVADNIKINNKTVLNYLTQFIIINVEFLINIKKASYGTLHCGGFHPVELQHFAGHQFPSLCSSP
jgi:hypothetical protein